MGLYRYRAVTTSGQIRSGALEGHSVEDALEQVRRLGLTAIEAVPARQETRTRKIRPVSRKVLARAFGELSVMVDAGAPLDYALRVVGEGVKADHDRAPFEAMRTAVREGRPLSRAMAEAGAALPPMSSALMAAGEADGRPAAALADLAETIKREHALRSTLISGLIYPAVLLVIALGVIALMLYWVVPQFETLFSDAQKLPPMTVAVLAISRFARRYGLYAFAAIALAAFMAMRSLQQPQMRRQLDRTVLGLPQIGGLIAMAETARLMRVLASLVGGGVALPEALAIARRSLSNSHMGEAVDRVARGLREGEGLTEPLAATGVFPKLALSYLRTGEQTAQLPLMLQRLAGALEEDVKTRLDRMIAILTPLMTVAMGATVALVIASIMTAILGFDDLALTS
ncbi:MAG: type II secretion system F family protein [Caulobacteraceae bacterium]|nr:type II secretion system F family protein [Caulobacteraceae bacterium]